jgi:arylformamidase
MKPYRDFTSQEEIDREYNVGAAVPDSAQWLERYAHESATTHREPERLLDLRFGPTLDETLEVFPAARPGAAVLVFIHEGYWLWGSTRTSASRRPVPRPAGSPSF